MIGGDPVDARDHAGVGARALAVEDPHRHQTNLLRHPVGRTAHRARDVRAMAVAVFGAAAVVDRGVAGKHPTAELAMGGTDTGVDDVGADVRGGGRIGVGAVQGQVALVDSIQAPGGVGLGGLKRPNLAILLHVGDARILHQRFDGGAFGPIHHEAAQGMLIGPLHLHAEGGGELGSGDLHRCAVAALVLRRKVLDILEYHDVTAWHGELSEAQLARKRRAGKDKRCDEREKACGKHDR